MALSHSMRGPAFDVHFQWLMAGHDSVVNTDHLIYPFSPDATIMLPDQAIHCAGMSGLANTALRTAVRVKAQYRSNN